jgi:hypothetical protein
VNTFGLSAGLVTLLILSLGFPLVIYSERFFGYVCWPYLMGIGMMMVTTSLLAQNSLVSVAVGISGATLVWGSTELKEQAVRARLGWFPQNRNKIRVPFADIIEKWKAPHL